ncbi:MAG: hypothetical protein HY896_11400 [Deltaproteobacteria bacterium]|nr:hypothetical protein [Deltaproteobacteria bacterium]
MVRNAYLKKIEEKLEGWDREIEKLKVKADKVETDAKAIYVEQIKVLRKKQEVARERIQDLREAGADNWGKFKSAVEESLVDLKKAVDTAISKIRKSA